TVDLRTLVTDVETTDKDQLTFTVGDAQHGTVALLPHGHTAQFIPDANYNGAASFSYSITDTGDGLSKEAALSEALTFGSVLGTTAVSAVNDAPVAQAGVLTTAEDTQASGPLTATDIDSAALSYSLVNVPSHGMLSLNANTGAFTYAPDPNYN